jgi:hypothetical protein
MIFVGYATFDHPRVLDRVAGPLPGPTHSAQSAWPDAGGVQPSFSGLRTRIILTLFKQVVIMIHLGTPKGSGPKGSIAPAFLTNHDPYPF